LTWSTDVHGIFNYLSPQFQTMFGFDPNDWIGKPFVDLVHPEDRDWMISGYVQTIQSGQTFKNAEFRHLHQDGHYIWASINTTPIINADGIPIGAQGVLADINDRKKAEQEILENHQLIQQIADSSPNVLYLYDLQEQRNTYTNREILVALGYSANDIQAMGAAWLPTVIHPDDLLPTLKHFERLKLAHDGETLSNEYRFRHANGEWRYFSSRDLVFSRDVDGQVKIIIGTAQDITDRKNTEAALRASDQRWQFALESAGDGIWDWNIQNNEVFFSLQWKAMLGYTDDEFENRFESWENLVHPDDIAQCYEDIDKCLNHETLLYENEHRLRCKDRSYKWILARGKVFEVDANGQALRLMGTHTDLSDRKRAALELQQLSERLTLALKSGAIGCWDWNINDNSLYWDDRMYEIYGVTKQPDDRLTYETWLQAVHPEDLHIIESILQQSAAGVSDFDAEFRIVRPDGEVCSIKDYGVVIRDSFGNAQSMIGINLDISDRKQAEAQLQQINKELLRATKLKDEFLANMSHELRTPLNAILGLSNVMGEQVLGSLNEKQLKAIGTVESSGEHLLSLINDILDLSKISSGMMELDTESVSVLNLCDSSLVFVKQQAFQKKVQIDSKIPQHINNINVEERRIRQVLVNLLSNAVKFTPCEGKVSLLVAFGQGDTWQGEAMIPQQFRIQNSPMIIFQVVDTGIGIDSNDLQRLFQPFIQVSSSLNRQYEGTGLGLALVKQIVELHGGQVMAESEVGKGSRFTFALPYDMAPSTPEAKQTPIALSPIEINPDRAIAPLILLVEDNEANIDTFTSYLTAINYRVIFAKNGRDALSMAKANFPDIILMDIQMPDIDGLEAIRLIRADESIAAIPIIAVTALAMEGDRERCLAAGANEYLSKPIKFRQLNSAIQQIL
jgi:PAS domain S-box-containing protein